jgi:hypothetical protein
MSFSNFSNFADAFTNNDIDQLDQMANQLNSNNKTNFEYYSTQGNMTLDPNTSDYYKHISYNKKTFGTEYPELTMSSFGRHRQDKNNQVNQVPEIAHDSLLSELSDQDIHTRKTQPTKQKLLDILDDHHITDETSVDDLDSKLEHIKKCQKCKTKFLEILNNVNSKHIFETPDVMPKPEIAHATLKYDMPTTPSIIEGFGKLVSNTDMKDILVTVLLGIIIILIIDAWNHK